MLRLMENSKPTGLFQDSIDSVKTKITRQRLTQQKVLVHEEKLASAAAWLKHQSCTLGVSS